MVKPKIAYSMHFDPELHKKLTTEAARLGVPKSQLIALALNNLFKRKSFGLKIA